MKTSFIPSYYAANVERLARFAALNVDHLREIIAECETNGLEHVATIHRANLQKWEAVLSNPAAYVNA